MIGAAAPLVLRGGLARLLVRLLVYRVSIAVIGRAPIGVVAAAIGGLGRRPGRRPGLCVRRALRLLCGGLFAGSRGFRFKSGRVLRRALLVHAPVILLEAFGFTESIVYGLIVFFVLQRLRASIRFIYIAI